jgi:hypothetical protein
MNITDEGILYKTITNAAMFLFNGGSYTPSENVILTRWILSHQNRYKGFIFYPTQADRENGIRLFSGEKPKTNFLADNAVELETLRILALIQPEAPEVQQVLQKAYERLFRLCFANGCTQGECAHASIAFMRYLTAYNVNGSSDKFGQTLEILKQKRSGDGKWHDFPFFFTLLWLTDLPYSFAYDELSYSHDHCKRLLVKKQPAREQIDLVKEMILQKALLASEPEALGSLT